VLILARTRDSATHLSRAFRQASSSLAAASVAAEPLDRSNAGKGQLVRMIIHPEELKSP